ncbi:uncharacterized protein [Dermacentor albipictus]|uniref:uncharacterized protein n=1 Tax=Dermacentor albipictus TaxID=60249 RepID=UPI0031FBA9F7
MGDRSQPEASRHTVVVPQQETKNSQVLVVLVLAVAGLALVGLVIFMLISNSTEFNANGPKRQAEDATTEAPPAPYVTPAPRTPATNATNATPTTPAIASPEAHHKKRRHTRRHYTMASYHPHNTKSTKRVHNAGRTRHMDDASNVTSDVGGEISAASSASSVNLTYDASSTYTGDETTSVGSTGKGGGISLAESATGSPESNATRPLNIVVASGKSSSRPSTNGSALKRWNATAGTDTYPHVHLETQAYDDY